MNNTRKLQKYWKSKQCENQPTTRFTFYKVHFLDSF